MLLASITATLVACGGGRGDPQEQGQSSPTQGQTVAGADGASVTFSSEDASKSVGATVRVARDGSGAPALAADVTAAGAVYQFTPLGLSSGAVTLRIPFDAASVPPGIQPRLLIALPGEGWTEVVDATFEGNTASAKVPQLAYAMVVYQAGGADPAQAQSFGLEGGAARALKLSVDAATSPALPAADDHGLVHVSEPTHLVLQARYHLPAVCPREPRLRIYGVQTRRAGHHHRLDFKTVTLADQALTTLHGSVRVEQDFSADNNGVWVFAATVHCPAARHGSARYAYLSTGPMLKVDVRPGAGIPMITRAPQSVGVIEGSMATFDVVAAGDNLAYQWQRSSGGETAYADVAGATAASVNLTAGLTDDGSLWRVIVRSPTSSVTSTPARLSVSAREPVPALPVVSQDPASQSVIEGATASFSAAAGGSPAPTVQWQSRPAAAADPNAGWANIANATALTYTTVVTTQGMSGSQYRAVFQNAAGSATTLPATLTVQQRQVAPSIATGPASQSVQAGQSGLFKVDAGGTAPLSYQWFKNGQPLLGANATEVLVPALAADIGSSYQITVQVSNAAGSVTSAAAAMAVTAPPNGGGGTLIDAAQGGVVTLGGMDAENATSLSIPPGALAANTTMSLTSEASSAVGLPADATPLGNIVRIGPANLAFVRPAVLSLPVPDNLPEGKVLALVELPEDGPTARSSQVRAGASADVINLRRLAMRPTRQGVAILAANDPPKIQCTDTNSFANGKLTALVSKTQRSMLAAVPSSQCTGYVLAPPRGPIPSDTDQACSKDEEFVALRGDNDDQERTLVSRHVDCRTALADLFDKQVFADLVENADGTLRYATAQEIDANNGVSGHLVGKFQQLEAQVSFFGSSRSLTKTLRMRVRIKDFQPDLFYKGPSQARQSVTARPEITCGNVNDNERGRCSFSVPQLNVPLGGGAWSSWVDIPITFAWNVPADPAKYDVAAFKVEVTNLAYVANGNADRNPGKVGLNNSYLDVRCDRNVAQAGTEGCVLPNAAPVFAFGPGDVTVTEFREHVREAQAVFKSPGKFILKANTRAMADDVAKSPTTALQRLKNGGDTNRAVACSKTATSLITIRPQYSRSCQPVNGVPPAACQCDEYPFNSTYQGAAFLPELTSVRYINGTHNQNAGSGTLTSWYTRERVLDLGMPGTPLPSSGDSDYFWVHIGDAS